MRRLFPHNSLRYCDIRTKAVFIGVTNCVLKTAETGECSRLKCSLWYGWTPNSTRELTALGCNIWNGSEVFVFWFVFYWWSCLLPLKIQKAPWGQYSDQVYFQLLLYLLMVFFFWGSIFCLRANVQRDLFVFCTVPRSAVVELCTPLSFFGQGLYRERVWSSYLPFLLHSEQCLHLFSLLWVVTEIRDHCPKGCEENGRCE